MSVRAHLARATALALVTMLGIAGLTTGAAADDTVAIPDATLSQCIHWKLGIDVTEPVTAAQMETLTSLSCGSFIASLDGLEHATRLKYLTVQYSPGLTDLSPLAWLDSLEQLTILGLGSIDLTPIAGLTSLTHLALRSGTFTAIPSLAGLPNLTHLDLSSSPVASLAQAASAPALTHLDADYAQLTDLSPLAGHPTLANLSVTGNHLTDVSTLSAIPSLVTYAAHSQRIPMPTTARCTLVAPTLGVTGIGGTALALTPDRGHWFGDRVLFTSTTTGRLRFSEGTFNGSLDYPMTGEAGSCPWPAELSPTVTVTGSSKQGQALTAAFSMADAPAGLVPYLRWEDATTGAGLASGADYVPSETQVGAKPRAVAEVWLYEMQQAEFRSPTQAAVVGAMPASIAASFLSPAVTGTTPTVTVKGFPATLPNPSFKYTWKLDGITVATTDWDRDDTWVIPASARGKKLSVTVSVKAPGYETKTYAGPSATVLGSFGPVGQVSAMTGTFEVGRTVSIKAPVWKVTPASYAYQWRRDGKAISGATGSTYKLTSADAGKRISVAIAPKRSGYYGAPYVSFSEKVKPLFSTAPQPRVSGSPTVGTTVKASVGSWSPTPTTFNYQWIRDGKAISGATKSTYTLTSLDAGKQIQVKVTAKRSGYSPHARYSPQVTVAKKLTAVTPTISGTTKVGSTLTVKRGTWGPGTVTTKVQWYVNGKAVSGATGSTYKVRPTDAYKSLTLKVTGSRSRYTTASRTSAAKKPTGIDYASCTDMRKHYPDGVAKSSSVRDKVGTKLGGPITARTFVSASLYALNDESDRDKDGWACEP